MHVCWCCPAPQKSIIRQRILHTLKMKRGSPSKYPLSENKHQICVKLCCRVMMHFFVNSTETEFFLHKTLFHLIFNTYQYPIKSYEIEKSFTKRSKMIYQYLVISRIIQQYELIKSIQI